MPYSQLKQDIALVDVNDNILGRVDKWEAHEKGLLHRAFTLILVYKDSVILQHRKHAVFNDVFDISISSHPVYEGDQLETNETALLKTLERETDLKESDITSFQHLGTINYQTPDPQSNYQEHEICHIYKTEIKKIPRLKEEFAYGMSLKPLDEVINPDNPSFQLFAPWVKEMIDQKIF